MESLKLKKTKTLRRRFIKSAAPLVSLNDWSDAFFDLKETVLAQSVYQLVGDKGVIQVDSKTGEGHALLEVVGVPKSGLEFVDHEGGQILVYEHPKAAFDVDFLTLKQEARAIMSKIPGTVASTYHIVVKGHHLSLHFFI